MNEPITGTWDALEDAAEALNRGGLAYIIIAGMDGNQWCRTRTNACDQNALDWMRKHGGKNLDQLRKGLPE